jgi:MFS family permease
VTERRDAGEGSSHGRAEERRPAGSEGLEPELLIEGLQGKVHGQPQSGQPVAREKHDPYAALRSGNYRAFAGGFVFSSTGLQMLSTGLAWEVWARTESAMALGVLGLSRAVPVILLALPAGHLVDLYNRKRLLVATQASYAMIAGAMALASWLHAPVWVLYFLVMLTGCTRVVNGPTRQSVLPLMVPPGVFSSAVMWNSGVFQFAAVCGPVLAGIIIAASGAAWPVYVATAAGCAVFSASATMIKLEQPARENGRFSVRSMFAGLSHLWREKTILATIALDLFAVLFGGAMGLLPIFAEKILIVESPWLGLHHASVRLGVLRAAPFVGALIMALVLAHMAPMRRAGRALLMSVAVFGVCWIVFGLSEWFWLSVAVLGISGAVDNISVVIRHVLVQTRTPDHLRGRVSAVNAVFIESSNELGAFESGAVAAAFGPVASVVSGGIGTILVVAGVALRWPQVRGLGRLEEPPERAK